MSCCSCILRNCFFWYLFCKNYDYFMCCFLLILLLLKILICGNSLMLLLSGLIRFLRCRLICIEDFGLLLRVIRPRLILLFQDLRLLVCLKMEGIVCLLEINCIGLKMFFICMALDLIFTFHRLLIGIQQYF